MDCDDGDSILEHKYDAADDGWSKLQRFADDAKQFILLSLRNTPSARASQNDIRFMWEDNPSIFWNFLSNELKEDRDIALAAFVNQHARHEDLSERWRQDRDFFLDAVAQKSSCWYGLPERFKIDPDFPRHFHEFEDDDLVAAVFEKIPFLCNDRGIWDTIISSPECTLELASDAVTSDRELMLKACSLKDTALQDVAEILALDRAFLEKVIEQNPLALEYLSHASQRTFPELLTNNLRRFFDANGNDYNLLQAIAQDIRTHPSFAKLWFTSGGHFWGDYFPESWKDDEQIFLWLAEYSTSSRACLQSFRHASQRLKGDREFMFKAIVHKPELFWRASHELQRNNIFLLKALAGSSAFASNFVNFGSGVRWQHFIQNVSEFLQRKVALHETFVSSVLVGISLSDDNCPCPLSVLNQGPETSLTYKKRIASYLGVPTGRKLRILRLALQNMQLAKREDERTTVN